MTKHLGEPLPALAIAVLWSAMLWSIGCAQPPPKFNTVAGTVEGISPLTKTLLLRQETTDGSPDPRLAAYNVSNTRTMLTLLSPGDWISATVREGTDTIYDIRVTKKEDRLPRLQPHGR